MTVSSLITVIQKIIDISLVWIIIYSVLKGLKNNIKMVLIFKNNTIFYNIILNIFPYICLFLFIIFIIIGLIILIRKIIEH